MSDPQVTYRRAEEGDVHEAYALFRRSLFDYLARTGSVSADAAANLPIEDDWKRQRGFVTHLARTASEHWVAEREDGRLVGWALSTEREGAFELVFFFVDPAEQSKGIGRGLLERAFPHGRGELRIVLATGHERALGLYLRFGVHGIGSSLSLYGQPNVVSVATDLQIERATIDDETVSAIVALERAIIGHARIPEIEFFLSERPVWLARRDDRPVGFAFGSNGDDTGPIGALDAADIPALLGVVETEAHAAGHPEIWFATPMANWRAVDHLLARGFRIFPFTAYELASAPIPGLERWVHTSPEFIL